MNQSNVWKIITVLEVIAAGIVIGLDLLMPTLIILGMIALSLLVRREKIGVLGFQRPDSWLRMILTVLLAVAVWQALQFSLFMPLLNRLASTTQDLSSFANLKGNLSQLLLLLGLSWTLAALGEEMVYRGYLQRRLGDIFGAGPGGLLLTVGISSLLFGIAHAEQGFIGVILTTLDALFFSWLKLKFKGNLWAAVLAHGFSNTIGLVVFYFTGPMYGLW